MIKKIMVSVSEELLEKIDKVVEESYSNRSAFLTAASIHYMQSLTASKAAKDMSKVMTAYLAKNAPQDEATAAKVELLQQILNDVQSAVE